MTFTFSEPVNVTPTAFTLECPGGTPITFTVTPASPASSFVLHPTANLPGGIVCTATAVAAQITDVDAGQAMTANAQTSLTIDAPPTVTTIVPANGATNVPLTSTVTITFSEPVNVTGTAFTLECPTGTPVAFGVSPASPATSFVLTPSANLPGGAACTTTVVASQVTDVDFGQNMAANFAATFTVDTPPTVTTTTPAKRRDGRGDHRDRDGEFQQVGQCDRDGLHAGMPGGHTGRLHGKSGVTGHKFRAYPEREPPGGRRLHRNCRRRAGDRHGGHRDGGELHLHLQRAADRDQRYLPAQCDRQRFGQFVAHPLQRDEQ